MHQVLAKPATIFLIRHAESEANVANDRIGGVDAPLSPNGVEQAVRLNDYLLKHPLPEMKEVHSSNMPRASRTAELLHLGLDCLPHQIMVDPRLREISRGDWESKARAETYTDEIRTEMAFLDMDHRAPGGESMSDTASRAREWLMSLNAAIIDEHDIRTFVAVTHGVLIKSLLQRIFGMEPRYAWLMEIDNTSITKIRCSSQGWHLEYVNATPHLPERGF